MRHEDRTIVWVNGPFGAGKTTVATLVAERWTRATLFDPEALGYLLRLWQPSDAVVGDFQKLSVWRVLVRETALGLLRDFGRPLVVPMTLLEPAYFEEIVGGLREAGIDVRHYCLQVSLDEVLRRVAERGDSGDWFPTKYDAYAPSLHDARFAKFLDAEATPASTLADRILEELGI